ncbi:MAG: glycine--tRNA ligase, partial [Leptospiraceae bacterium]|nr:glycine--tRNA ligase [Leptospiraceae bacterium]
PSLAPVKAGIFPLMKKDGLPEIAEKLYKDLAKHWPVDYDISGAIGKRYYRQDELGTPFCITVDYESKDDAKATVRERDSRSQERVSLDRMAEYIRDRLQD